MAFKRPFNSNDQGSSAKKPFSGSSMKFISFTQSSTRNDGTRSEGQNPYQETQETKYKAPDIDVMRMVNPRELNEKKRWMEHLHMTVKERMNSDRGSGKSLTDNLSHCIQKLKTNPQYTYVELARLNVDDIPRDVKRSYHTLPSEGYVCECRVQGVYLGMGLSVSKAGSRDKAIEQAMGVLDNREVDVVATQRQWKDKNYPDFVLTSSRDRRRENMHPFFSPPEGTKEFERDKDREMRMRHSKQKSDKPYQGNPNLHHIGPAVSGIRMENFVIMLKPNENPVCILNTSAQFCKMAVDFFFEKVMRGGDNDFLCTVFVEGEPVADAKGPKKTLKHVVADNALKCLSKMCHTVVITDSGVDKGSMMSRREIKNKSVVEEKTNKLTENNIGNKMLRMMGWKEGEGLGHSGDSIVEPIQIKNESINKEGLGSNSINSDNITRDEASEIIKNYASSDAIEDLTFSSELSFDERKEIKMMAKRYGLSERTVMENMYGRKRVFLVLSKKVGPEVIIEQLEKDERWGRYQLVKPEGGDRFVTNRFLNHQNLRQCKGFPNSLLNNRDSCGFGGFRGGERDRSMGYGDRKRNSSGWGFGGSNDNDNIGRFGRERDDGFKEGRTNRNSYQNNSVGFNKAIGDDRSKGFYSCQRDMDGFGMGALDGRGTALSTSYSTPSFTIGSGGGMGGNNQNRDERCSEFMTSSSSCGDGAFQQNRDRIDQDLVMQASTVDRMSRNKDLQRNMRNSDEGRRNDFGSNFTPGGTARGQFWQQMTSDGGNAGSRSYSVRGRKKSNIPNLMDL